MKMALHKCFLLKKNQLIVSWNARIYTADHLR